MHVSAGFALGLSTLSTLCLCIERGGRIRRLDEVIRAFGAWEVVSGIVSRLFMVWSVEGKPTSSKAEALESQSTDLIGGYRVQGTKAETYCNYVMFIKLLNV